MAMLRAVSFDENSQAGGGIGRDPTGIEFNASRLSSASQLANVEGEFVFHSCISE